MESWAADRTHLVGLDQVEVLAMHAEAMLEVAALLLTPGAQPVCRGGGQSAAEQELGGPQADQRSPRITFTLNRSLRRASSALKLHFTSSYSAWGLGGWQPLRPLPAHLRGRGLVHITTEPGRWTGWGCPLHHFLSLAVSK